MLHAISMPLWREGGRCSCLRTCLMGSPPLATHLLQTLMSCPVTCIVPGRTLFHSGLILHSEHWSLFHVSSKPSAQNTSRNLHSSSSFLFCTFSLFLSLFKILTEGNTEPQREPYQCCPFLRNWVKGSVCYQLIPLIQPL